MFAPWIRCSVLEVALGLREGVLAKALCKRKIKAGQEMVEQDLRLSQATDGRDALSKAIYSRLFDALIGADDAAHRRLEHPAENLRMACRGAPAFPSPRKKSPG